MKSYGRAPTFLLTTGYKQIRPVVAAVAGDHAAAGPVELPPLASGTCQVDACAGRPAAAGACCG
jgi:hypothetical protein